MQFEVLLAIEPAFLYVVFGLSVESFAQFAHNNILY